MPCIGLKQLDQAGRGIRVPFVWAVDFNNTCFSHKHHLSESDWPYAFCTGGATETQARTEWFPLVDKMSRKQGSLFFNITMI